MFFLNIKNSYTSTNPTKKFLNLWPQIGLTYNNDQLKLFPNDIK